MTTYREFFNQLTEEQLEQPMIFYPEDSAPQHIEAFVLVEDLGYPLFDDSNILDTKASFESSLGDSIDDEEFKVVYPKGTVFITPKS